MRPNYMITTAVASVGDEHLDHVVLLPQVHRPPGIVLRLATGAATSEVVCVCVAIYCEARRRGGINGLLVGVLVQGDVRQVGCQC